MANHAHKRKIKKINYNNNSTIPGGPGQHRQGRGEPNTPCELRYGHALATGMVHRWLGLEIKLMIWETL